MNDADTLQEGKIDRGYSPWEFTARENHLFGLKCPGCGLRAMSTKVLTCSRCGELMGIDREWHVSETSLNASKSDFGGNDD